MIYYIGLDVGTTAVKAIACNDEGKIFAKSLREYSLVTKSGGVVEQDARDWWQCSAQCLKDITDSIAKQGDTSPCFAGMCLSTQGGSMLAVDKDFNPLCPVITWMDMRSEKECAKMVDILGGDKIYKTCGWQASASCDASKILWLKENAPEVFEEAFSFVSTVEYMNYMLTDVNSIDRTNGGIRQLLDIKNKQWDSDILNVIGIDSSRLPIIKETGDKVGGLTPRAAEATGLPVGMPVYQGAHDQYCAAVGSGTVEAGDIMVATGTTWVLLGVVDHLAYTPSQTAVGIHPQKGLYGMMRSVSCGGTSLKWLTNIMGNDDLKAIDGEAATRRDKAKNVFCVPYFTGGTGKREALASFRGLSLDTDGYDLALAIMESVVFEIRKAMEEFARNGVPSERVVMTGGASKSQLWAELTAFITGKKVYRCVEKDTAALGAAIISAVSSGRYADHKIAAAHMVAREECSIQDSEAYEFYKEKYRRYVEIS